MSNVIIDCNTATHMYVDFTAYNMYFSLLPLVSTKIITFERINICDFFGGGINNRKEMTTHCKVYNNYWKFVVVNWALFWGSWKNTSSTKCMLNKTEQKEKELNTMEKATTDS